MEFKSAAVTRITDVKRLRLHSWIERGFFKPGDLVRGGPGKPNVYNEFDIYKIGFLKYLIDNGLSRKVAGEISGSIVLKGYADYLQKVKRDIPLWFIVVLKKDALNTSWVHIPRSLTGETLGPVETHNPQQLEGKIFNLLNSGTHEATITMMIDLRKIIDPISKKIHQEKSKKNRKKKRV